jgi:hypothetical protein
MDWGRFFNERTVSYIQYLSVIAISSLGAVAFFVPPFGDMFVLSSSLIILMGLIFWAVSSRKEKSSFIFSLALSLFLVLCLAIGDVIYYFSK